MVRHSVNLSTSTTLPKHQATVTNLTGTFLEQIPKQRSIHCWTVFLSNEDRLHKFSRHKQKIKRIQELIQHVEEGGGGSTTLASDTGGILSISIIRPIQI